MTSAELLASLRNSFVAGFDGGWRLFWSPFSGLTRALRSSFQGVLREAENNPIPDAVHQGIKDPAPPVSQAADFSLAISPERSSDIFQSIPRMSSSALTIGQITEQISEIVERTNLLALEAAIQATAAGEDGKGFSIVAEEARRLAESSSVASRQIAAIVRTIQADTWHAMQAMEREAPKMEYGAPMSSSSGTAIADVERVTRELAELIEQISSNASREAKSAKDVAADIHLIFETTAQARKSLHSTEQLVSVLVRTAAELRAGVSKLKVK